MPMKAFAPYDAHLDGDEAFAERCVGVLVAAALTTRTFEHGTVRVRVRRKPSDSSRNVSTDSET